MDKKFGKHLKVVLKKMCSMVKADPDKIDFQKDAWYHEYVWTEKQENDFKKWFVDYLLKNKEARQEFCYVTLRDKKYISKAVDMFVFNYGWKTKE